VATIKDVAKRAEVAISTVSAVINRSAPVSEFVIEKVQKAIAEIGYVPHGAARSLRSGQSRLVGLVVPDITNPHFATAARVVESVCLSRGYMAVVLSTGQDADRENQILQMMRMQRMAGMIIIPSGSDAEHGAHLLAELNGPTVLLDSHIEGMPHDVFKLDNVEAARLAVDYLLGLGHRRIAILKGPDGIATADDRLEGCRIAFAAHGLTLDESLCLEGGFAQAEAFGSTLSALARSPRPTAIFAMSNMMTLGVIRAVFSQGLSIPGDVSVIGIDDFEWAEIMSPRLTLVAQPNSDMARDAVEALLEQIETKQPPAGRLRIYPPRLVLRNSCAAAPDAPGGSPKK